MSRALAPGDTIRPASRSAAGRGLAARRPTRRRLLRLLAGAGLVVLPLVVYRHLLDPARAPGDFDAFAYVYPYGRSLAQAWSSGRWLPLWNPDIFLGAPLLANNPAAALSPLTLLFLVVPGPGAIGWSMVLHLAIAGLGMLAFGLRAAR